MGGLERPRIKDVAARAGVSLGTVSYVLNQPDRVASATRRRVLRAIDALGYVRNEPARQLRAGRGRALGLVVPTLTNPFYADIADGFQEAAHAAGMVVVLGTAAPNGGQLTMRVFAEQRVTGVVIIPEDIPVGHLSGELGMLRDHGVPTVVIDRRLRARDVCTVASDDVRGGELAAAHLAAIGCTRIAYVAGPTSNPPCGDRLSGARRVARRRGMRIDVYEEPDFTLPAGAHAASRLLAKRRLPDAIFCANDLLALGALQELVMASVRVPDQLALMGYDDIAFAAAATVPLTTVRQPREELGRAAVQMLLEHASAPDRHQHRHVVFTPQLVVRASTDG